MTQNTKTRLWSLGLLALAFAGVLAGCAKQATSQAIPPVGVIAAEVLVRDQPVLVEAIGQTRGARDVEIRARVAGFLERCYFTEGRLVESNAPLYLISRGPFEAAVAQARGALLQAEAAWEKAMRDTNRFGPLWEKRAISRQQYDDRLAAEQAAAAVVQSARAAVDSAEFQLGYTAIRSPIRGIVGKSEVSEGNLVGQGTATLLTVVSAVDPIQVRFSVSEREYLMWRQKGASSGEPGEIFEMVLADGRVYPHKGKLVFGDREVDPATGTFLLQVEFPNRDLVIRPGQFARVRFAAEEVPGAILVPQRAVQELQGMYSVFLVGQDNKAAARRVEIASRVENFYLVKSGLAAGDRIVIEGLQKLTDKAPLAVTMTNLTLAAR